MSWKRTFDLATVSVLATMLARLLADPTRINHDSASLLMGPLMVSEGRMPLSALFSTMNPPLISYIGLLVTTLAGWLGGNVILLFQLTVLTAALVSVAAVRRLLSGGGLVAPPTAGLVTLAWACCLFLPFLDADFSFGQREYLVTAALVPYLVGRWRHWEGVPSETMTKILLGVGAGLATCLKPHYLLVPALVELAWITGRRRLSPAFSVDVFAYVLTGVAFVGHILLLPAELRTAFLGGLGSTAQGYDAYDASWPALLHSPWMRFTLVSCPIVLALVSRYRSAGLRLAGTFALMGIVSAAIYFGQRKGWGYHALPASDAALMALAVLATSLPRFAALTGDSSVGSRRGAEVWAFRLALVAATLTGGSATLEAITVFRTGVRPVLRSPFSQALLTLSSPREEILFITTDVYPMFPTLLELDRRTFGKYWGPTMGIAFFQAGLTMTPSGFPYRRMDQMTVAERRFLEDLGRDIRLGRPRLIVVSDGPHLQGCPPGFDLMEYLRRAPPVIEALSSYATVARVPLIRGGGVLESYRFLRREDAGSGVRASGHGPLPPGSLQERMRSSWP